MFQIHVYVLLTQMRLGQRTPLGATLLEARQADLLTSVRCQRYAAEDVGVINQSHYKAPFSTLAAESCVVIFTFVMRDFLFSSMTVPFSLCIIFLRSLYLS